MSDALLIERISAFVASSSTVRRGCFELAVELGVSEASTWKARFEKVLGRQWHLKKRNSLTKSPPPHWKTVFYEGWSYPRTQWLRISPVWPRDPTGGFATCQYINIHDIVTNMNYIIAHSKISIKLNPNHIPICLFIVGRPSRCSRTTFSTISSLHLLGYDSKCLVGCTSLHFV